MTAKRKTEKTFIVGVSEDKSRQALEAQKRGLTIGSAAVSTGSMYAYGLAYPEPATLPPGEAAITALAVSQQGFVFGATSGLKAHLFWMIRPLMVGDLGVIEGVRNVAEGLALDSDTLIYGAGRGDGDPIFTCDSTTGGLGPYSARTGKIELHRGPFKDDGVRTLTISRDKTVIAGVAERTGRLFLMPVKSRRIKVLAAIVPEKQVFCRALAATADNQFIGTGKDGQLFQLSPDGDMKWLPAHIPCRKGKAYLARATSFTTCKSGLIYGGTEDGYLFSWNPSTGHMASHGRVNDIPDLHAVAEGGDGCIYGLTGRGKWVAHLVRFRPDRAEWEDLGLFHSYAHTPWTGYQMRALVAGPEGQLYAGEYDRMGHLFIYHPPIVAG